MAHPTGSERAALSRDLSEFLVELSIALHKYAMYPGEHPSLGPAVLGVIRRAELILESRAMIALGVARQQLVIEGVATDPKHPVLRDLAARLHRHHLGAVTFRKGVTAAELGLMLRTLAVDAERSGQPLGLGPREALRAWAHIELHPVSFERLELVGQGGEGEEELRPAQLWIGLARAALAAEDDPSKAPPTTEPVAIAQAIEEHAKSAAYDQVIVGYLLQIADELKESGGVESAALRRRLSRLIGAMRPDTLRRLVDMGGDALQRQQFVLGATHGMSVDAVVEIVKATADVSGQTISHGLLRMLTKMAAHAVDGQGPAQQRADLEVREQVRSLLTDWSLADPNPEAYGRALQGLARAAPPSGADTGLDEPEALRIVQTELELDHQSAPLWLALSSAVDAGQAAELVEMLDHLPSDHQTAFDVWKTLVSPGVVRRLLAEPVDFKTLDRLLPRLDAKGMEPVLDALATSQNRTTRRGLLDRLSRVPVDLSPLLLERLGDDRWYVQRNMLVLLDSFPALPESFAPATFATHDDPRVRREALKLRLKMPKERDAAIVDGLNDLDPQVTQLALIAAQQDFPPAAAAVINRRIAARTFGAEERALAVKLISRSHRPEVLDALLSIADGGRTWFGRRRLRPKSPELLAALIALAGAWSSHPRARALLVLAGRSNDAEIRAAAGQVAG